MKFNKPAFSQFDLLTKLEHKGILITDMERAKRYLLHIGYYRLSAYMIPFHNKKENSHFIAETTFDDLLNLYLFDRKLRLHLLEAIERIEISLRAQITDNFVIRHGPHAYLDSSKFRTSYNHHWLITQITKQFDISTEVFIEHYKRKYHDPYLPPFWMVIQLLTFKCIIRRI